MSNNQLQIHQKFLSKMIKTIQLKPFINVSILDMIDVYNLKKSSPNVEDERLYRVCLCSLHNDKLVNKFAIRMKAFDISTGSQRISIKEIPLNNMKKWKDYKAIQQHLQDFKPYEEVSSLDIKKFVEFCDDNKINERQIWHLLLDDTYTKSEEIVKIFYPTIIPLPGYLTMLQKYNSHSFLFTQAKTGKSETCFRLYPQENFEDISIPTLLGTQTKNEKRIGLLDGEGLFFIDEINKLTHMRSSMSEENSKILDFCCNYLERGIEKRGLWGKKIEVSGTRTMIFSGNVNIINPGEKDFYHLMSKICNFHSDSDKFGRRVSIFIYSNKLNNVDNKLSVDQRIIDIINAFRKEINNTPQTQKAITKIYLDNLEWVNSNDDEHKKKILEYIPQFNSQAIQSFIKGVSLGSHYKLKFMALRITIINNIFHIIKKGNKDFFENHEEEIICEYNNLKKILCYDQIENLLTRNREELKSGRERIRKYVKEHEIDINETISDKIKEEMSKDLKISFNTIKDEIRIMRQKENLESYQND